MEKQWNYMKEWDRDFVVDHHWQDQQGNDHDTATFSLHGRVDDDEMEGYVRLKHPGFEEVVMSIQDAGILSKQLSSLLRAMRVQVAFEEDPD